MTDVGKTLNSMLGPEKPSPAPHPEPLNLHLPGLDESYISQLMQLQREGASLRNPILVVLAQVLNNQLELRADLQDVKKQLKSQSTRISSIPQKIYSNGKTPNKKTIRRKKR